MKMIRSLLPALTASALLLTGCAASADEPAAAPVASDAPLAELVPEEYRGQTLTVVNGDSNPPMYLRDDANQITGITIELGTAAADLLGLELDVEANSFDSTIPGLQAGNYDLSLWATDLTSERMQIIDQIPIGDVGYGFLIPNDGELGDDMFELCGLTIAAIKGQTTIPVLEEQSAACADAGAGEIEVASFPDQASATLAVKSGRADAATVNSVSGAYTAEIDPEVAFDGPVFNLHLTGIATAQGNGLGEAFAAALQQLVDDGTYGEILAKYSADSMALSEIVLNAPTSENG